MYELGRWHVSVRDSQTREPSPRPVCTHPRGPEEASIKLSSLISQWVEESWGLSNSRIADAMGTLRSSYLRMQLTYYRRTRSIWSQYWNCTIAWRRIASKRRGRGRCDTF
jgi:hypothetical protein